MVKPDLRHIRKFARRRGFDPDAFAGFVEDCKHRGLKGTKNERGDFTEAELREIAASFEDEQGRSRPP
jgi:hypothetical protein